MINRTRYKSNSRGQALEIFGNPIVLYVTGTVYAVNENLQLRCEDASALRFDITFVADCDRSVFSLSLVAVAVCGVNALLLKRVIVAICLLLRVAFGRARTPQSTVH